MNKPQNISNNEWKLLLKKYPNFEEIESKIKEGYPIQYLLGNTNFYGYDFYITPDVLIPRFETETLIEKLINLIKSNHFENSKCIDIGTGSGVIAITLKKQLPNLDVSALDISATALKIAQENAKLNNVKINFLKENIFTYDLVQKYDIIVSNPPYIEGESNYDKTINFEPSEAIFVSSQDPLIFYRRILELSTNITNPKHIIAFEIDEDHGNDMVELSKKYFPNDKILLENDLTEKNRYIFILSE